MSDPLQIRASSLPILDKCMGMLDGDYTPADVIQTYTTEGTVIHAEIAKAIQSGSWKSDNEVAQKIINSFSDYLATKPFDRFHVEHTYRHEYKRKIGGNVVISGHPDVVAITTNNVPIVVDYKSGWLAQGDGDENHIATKHISQLLCYAWLVLLQEDGSEYLTISGVIIDRFGKIQSETWNYDDIMKWAESLKSAIENRDSKLHTGDHCTYCPRRFACPARMQMLRFGVETFVGKDAVIDLTKPEDKLKYWQILGELAKLAEQQRDIIKSVLDFDDTKPIYLTPVTKEVIEPLSGLSVIIKHLSDEELAGCITIVKTKLEPALKAKAGRGGKDSYVKEVYKELRDAGALVEVPGSPRVTIRKESK